MSRSSSRRRLALGVATLVAALALPAVAAAAAPGDAPPWRLAADLRRAVADVERALLLEEPAAATEGLARGAAAVTGLDALLPDRALADQYGALERAAARGDVAGFAAARATLHTSLLAGAYRTTLARLERGDVEGARRWLLVREFRAPTRFSRPGADATLAVEAYTRGTVGRRAVLAAVRADALDTYEARLRTALQHAGEAQERGFGGRLAAEASLARGYFGILEPSFRRQRGQGAALRLSESFERLAAAALAGDDGAVSQHLSAVDSQLMGFRAAPLTEEEEVRRAGQFLRFLALVPVEYGRGVADGRVTVPFEIQEAVTFRDGASQAFGDLERELLARAPVETRRIDGLLTVLGEQLAGAARGGTVAPEEDVEARASEALELAKDSFPDAWQDPGAADFDVIRASLDRVVAAVNASEYGKAEQARLEAYAFFEFGPEQRLRGLAPGLFATTEGLFWYGADGHPGLAQLIRRKSAVEEVVATRDALDTALADAEAAVGSGPTSATAVVVNTAIIVFREGLEAVLILAALTAGLVGAKRGLRRPLLLGAGAALVASVVTFVVAKTVLASLVRYGERVEAVVSLLAIAVLLLILNWFFHKVYWGDHLANLHGRKKHVLRGAGISVAAAQFLGLAMLGFTAVYREGFETVLFLQALALEAGTLSVAQGALLGGAAVAAVGWLTIALQRKLPHRRMLELTGLLILAVLVVMVGKTVQVSQVVGWLPVHPIGELRLPYWAGLWFGLFPTWEGAIAQLGAIVFVLGSYVAAEWLRGRNRARRFAPPVPPKTVVPSAPAPARVVERV